MKNSKFIIFSATLFFSLCFNVQSTIAQSWTQTDASIHENWNCVASSADGRKLIAVSSSSNFGTWGDFNFDGSIYLSTNSGASWTLASNAPIADWISVCSSADGSKLTAIVASGPIYRSDDSGATWVPIETPSPFLDCITCSAVGDKLFAGAWDDFVGQRSLIYSSINLRQGWRSSHTPFEYWTAIACSANGKNLVATCVNPSDTGGVFISHDFGQNWRMTTAPVGLWYAVASSADGSKLAAAIPWGSIYISTNSGVTWTATDAPKVAWTSLAFSADGKKLVAAANYGGPIYSSNDSGATWAEADAPYLHWTSITSSADGNKLVAVSFQDGIYTLQTTPTPQLTYFRAGKMVVISWIVPSATFVLQESTDEIHWRNVTNQPVLDRSDLKYYVCLSLSARNEYFRLILR